jgi:hypothetical protein
MNGESQVGIERHTDSAKYQGHTVNSHMGVDYSYL